MFVETLRLLTIKVCECFQDTNTVLLNDLLLACAFMAHLQQGQLAVIDKHLTGRVCLRLSRACHTFNLGACDGCLGVALVRLNRMVDDLQVVEAADEVWVLRLC